MNQIISKEYFQNANKIPDKLFSIGDLKSSETKRISVVGSRRPSLYGRMAVEKIISGAKNYPISIVSGLAIGIDSLAHEIALKNNIHTIAIPGSGLEKSVLYPKTNLNLANRIIENGGALLSIWENQSAAPWTFPVRNSVMAAISDFVLIIEAEVDSGTMITVREALKRNIKIGAIPGNIDSIFSTGPNKLIKEGASLITSFDDIIKIIGLEKNNSMSNVKKQDDGILKYITCPCYKDDLANISGLSISEINVELTMLEISGDISIDQTGLIRIM